MPQFSIGCYVTSLATLLIAIVTFFFNRKTRTNRVFVLYSLSICEWSFFAALHASTSSAQLSLLSAKIMHVGVLFIPVLFTHFCYLLLDSYERHKRILTVGYFISFVLIIINITSSSLICDVRPKLGYDYFMDAGPLYYLVVIYFSVYVIQGLLFLFKAYQVSTGNKRNQLKYLLLGSVVGYIFGVSNFLPVYDVIVFPYPFGSYAITFYVGITAYAIMRYRLMDIRLIAVSTSIFVLVYSITLGIPFYIYKLGQHWASLVVMGILATMGPSIYLFFQRRVNEALLAEQRRYQQTLIQASSGMGHIKDLRRLVKLIARIVMRSVKPEHVAVYVFDKSRRQHVLGASLSKNTALVFPEVITGQQNLIGFIREKAKPVLLDELRSQANGGGLLDLSLLSIEASSLQAALLVPSIMDGRMVAFLVLGGKASGADYSADDISVFTILANQSALAIENAQFYEDVKRTQEQLYKAEKMATIGTMADGLSHQINNRFHAMGFVASDLLDTLQMRKEMFAAGPLETTSREICYGLERILENVKQGGEIVRGLLKYSRHTDEGFVACDIDGVLAAAKEMIQFKVKDSQMTLVRNYNVAEMPQVKGNFTQLQEVFFNLIDNAYDAMVQRKAELGEPGYQPTLAVQVSPADVNMVQVVFCDNGIGVKGEDRHKLFTPFFTTKATSKKGTGLGLYVIRKIVEENHGGRVEVSSQYHKGTEFRLLLPRVI